MDDDLRQKFAPRRNKRYAHLRGFNEEADWADALDWKRNDYDFHRLTRSILDRLDSEYREKWGLRVAQLASPEEIQNFFRTCRTQDQEQEQMCQVLGPYAFLYCNLELSLDGRASHILDRRRELAQMTD